jgi:GNAT superfamily N-acetyltransferase
MVTLGADLSRQLSNVVTGSVGLAGQTVVLEQVSSHRQRKEFVDFAWHIYEGDCSWCPPLKIEVHAAIDSRRHPFYRHGAAAQFLARRKGEVVGRVCVSDDPNYNVEHQTNVGCFGMFETIQDEVVSQSLLNAAAGWLRERGRTSIMGPIDYSTNYPTGLLIAGFDMPQRVMMNHNPPYYAELLEQWGLHKAKDLYAWWFDTSNSELDKWTSRAARLAHRGLTIRHIRFDDFDNEVERCLTVYNQAWENLWGFVKMTREEFRHMAYQLKRIAVPELLLLAEVDSQPIGFCITLPDFNEAIRPLNGRLTWCGIPTGLFKLLRRMKKLRTGRMVTLGVLPGFRRRGIAELLILQAFQYAKHQLKYSGAELSWTLEDNDLINRTIEAVGGQIYKRYRIYERTI